MPVIPKPKSMEWAQESPSVMESTTERALRTLAQLVGAGDPDSEATSLMPTPLISIFKDKLQRQAATQAFVEKMQNTFGKNLATAGENFAYKYPRIAAHMNPNAGDVYGTAYANVELPPGTVKEPLRMNITPFGEVISMMDPRKATENVFHEGTHVAQALGNRHMNQAYNLAHVINGYRDNPFERAARASAKRNVDRIHGSIVQNLDTGIGGTDRLDPAGRTTQNLRQTSKGLTGNFQVDLAKRALGNLLDYREDLGAQRAMREVKERVKK